MEKQDQHKLPVAYIGLELHIIFGMGLSLSAHNDDIPVYKVGSVTASLEHCLTSTDVQCKIDAHLLE